ncbi:MAG TPA: hypothetical protein VK024_09445 [Actinomycetaceae bacterium]|nr:hypothetical protein [Actinomycetaceae bacterium]
MRRRKWTTRVAAGLLALVLIIALAAPLMAAPLADDDNGGGAGRAERGAAADVDPAAELSAGRGPVLFIGTGGVRWEDLSAVATPHMWRLAEHGALANLVVRSVRSSTCPADGWLAISAGRRAADQPADQHGVCRQLMEPDREGVVPGWEDYREAAETDSYDARLGLLAETLGEAGRSAAGIGPGAAIALADADGVVETHQRRQRGTQALRFQVRNALSDADLVVFDAGVVRDRNRPDVPAEDPRFAGGMPDPDPNAIPSEADWPLVGPDRTDQVAAVDKHVGIALHAAEQHAEGGGAPVTVVFASLADSGTQPLMQVLAAHGPAYEPSLIATRSTRQPGMAQTTDLTPTLLDLLDVEAGTGLAGSPLLAGPAPGIGATRIATLIDENRHAVAIRPLVAPFISGLILINLLLYATVTIGLNRRFLTAASRWLVARGSGRWRQLGRLARRAGNADPAGALRVLRGAAMTIGSVPLASYLANLLPWWRTRSPGLVLITAVVIIAALIAGLGLARWWRYRPMVPMGVVAGLTMVVLMVDAVLGARMQLSALLGVQPQVGGRFYGFNNSSFALLAAASVLFAASVAEPLVARGRRRLAALAIAVIGVVVTVVDGAPTIGADFGGPPALIPAFIVMALLALGVRLTWLRVLATLAVTALASISLSVLDWLRPPNERSHLGRFIETVLDGGVANVVLRKLEQNLANLVGSTLTFLAIGGIALVLVIILRPLQRAARHGDAGAYGWLAAGSSIGRLDTDIRMVRPALVGLGISLGIGFAVNDSGIVVPAMGVSLAVPLLIVMLTTWLLGLRRARATVPILPR